MILILRRVRQFEKEYDKHKHNDKEYRSRLQERVTTFIKLCKKYVQKLNNVINVYTKLDLNGLTSVTQSKEKLLDELATTMGSYSKTVNNPNLINSLLECNNKDYSELIEEDYSNREDFYKNESMLVEVVKGLEGQIFKLQQQNDELRLKQNDEDDRLKRKLKEEKAHREEIESGIRCVKQVNRELESRLHLLEDENRALRNNFKETVSVWYYIEKG
jgi:hypothetical protein